MPTATVDLAEATPTSSVIAVADKCANSDLNNDGLVNSIDRVICLQNQVTPTPPEPTIVEEVAILEPTIAQEIVTPIPTSAPVIEQPPRGTFADLGFAAWWGLVLAMASAGTLASTLLLGMLKSVSTTVTANLAAGKYKMAVAPTENNLVISRGDIAEKLFYVTQFGVIDDNTCWVNLSGNEGLVLGKLSQSKISEGFYKVSGYTVTSAVNPYVAIEKITPLEKNG